MPDGVNRSKATTATRRYSVVVNGASGAERAARLAAAVSVALTDLLAD